MFCLSLLPFVTAWMGESRDANVPTALYGIVMPVLAVAWYLLVLTPIACDSGLDSFLAQAAGRNHKTLISSVFNIIGIPRTLFANSRLAVASYLSKTPLWILRDRQIENNLNSADQGRPLLDPRDHG